MERIELPKPDYKTGVLPLELHGRIGRSSRIQTYDILLPKQTLYQTELYSEKQKDFSKIIYL